MNTGVTHWQHCASHPSWVQSLAVILVLLQNALKSGFSHVSPSSMSRALHYVSSWILSEICNAPTSTPGNFQGCYTEKQYQRWQNPCPWSTLDSVKCSSSSCTEELGDKPACAEHKDERKNRRKPGRPMELCKRILCEWKMLLVLTKEIKIFWIR